MKEAVLWFRFLNTKFNGDEPRYFDTSHENWAKQIEQQYPAIREEILEFVEHHISELKDYRFHITDGKPQWQTFSLLAWGYIHRSRTKMLPTTWKVFRKIPGITSVSVSRLIAGVTIPAHHGDTNAIYRCHLGLKIPAGSPDCMFVVEGEEREWQEGKILSFCDARYHYAQNLTSEDRYVILFDVIRPEYIQRTYHVCAAIIGTHFLHLIDMKFPFYEKCPVWILKVLLGMLTPAFNLLLRLQHLVFRFGM